MRQDIETSGASAQPATYLQKTMHGDTTAAFRVYAKHNQELLLALIFNLLAGNHLLSAAVKHQRGSTSHGHSVWNDLTLER